MRKCEAQHTKIADEGCELLNALRKVSNEGSVLEVPFQSGCLLFNRRLSKSCHTFGSVIAVELAQVRREELYAGGPFAQLVTHYGPVTPGDGSNDCMKIVCHIYVCVCCNDWIVSHLGCP